VKICDAAGDQAKIFLQARFNSFFKLECRPSLLETLPCVRIFGFASKFFSSFPLEGDTRTHQIEMTTIPHSVDKAATNIYQITK
jgi:hypothetical protein